jgi:hypothetical protein
LILALKLARAAVDPIFAVIEAHRAALQSYDAAEAHFRTFWDWPIEQRFAWQTIMARCNEKTPRDIAYDRWNDLSDAVNVATEALVDAAPVTIAGAAAGP